MGNFGSKPAKKEEDTVGKAIEKGVDHTVKAVDKAADKAVETVTVFQKKVEKALEPEKDDWEKIKDNLPTIGWIALGVAAVAYAHQKGLFKKVWKKITGGDDAQAPASA